MVDDDKEAPGPPPAIPPRQQATWVPDQWWEQPRRQPRNLNLNGPQDFFVPPPPVEPPPGGMPPALRDVADAFQKAERLGEELAAVLAEFRRALPAQTSREVGPGHNQGPPISPEELDDPEDLIALLKDKGPTPAPVDRPHIKQQAEKTVLLSDRLKTWLGALVIMVVTVDGREVIKDLTASLCQAVADKLAEFGHAVLAWLSLLI